MKHLFFLTTISLVSLAFPEPANRHLGLNVGLGLSKTFLGGFYSWDRNQINVGTDVIAFVPGEELIIAQPSVTYNRYLTASGFYAMVGVQATYAPDSYEIYTPPTPPDSVGTFRTVKEPSWRTPILLTGIGRSFQFTNWGFHGDASLLTPLNAHLGRAWGIWVGGSVSYRFKLGD